MRYCYLSLLILCGCMIGFGCACSPDDEGTPEKMPDHFIQKITANLSLEVVSSRVAYYAGEENQTIRFRLRNNDLKAVMVKDWRMKETENLELYYALCPPGESAEIPAGAWRKGYPAAAPEKSLPGAVRCTPLILTPNNATYVDLPLLFLKSIPVQLAGKQVVAIRAKTTIPSLPLESRIFEITLK